MSKYYNNVAEFASAVADNILNYLPDSYQTAEVEVRTVEKNNGVTLTGLCVMKQESNIAPTLYLDDYFERYDGEVNAMAEACEQIARAIQRYEVGSIDITEITQWEKVKDKVFPKLINKDTNAELLTKIPFSEYLDMAVVYMARIGNIGPDGGEGSVTIHNQIFEKYGISKEELDRTARHNLSKEGYAFLSLRDKIIDMMGEQAAFMIPEEGSQIYFLSNDKSLNGASEILNENAISEIAEKIGDFIILPSSIHEVLIVPVSMGSDIDALRCMVNEINGTVVDPMEVLSDNVYIYEAGEIQIAGKAAKTAA